MCLSKYSLVLDMGFLGFWWLLMALPRDLWDLWDLWDPPTVESSVPLVQFVQVVAVLSAIRDTGVTLSCQLPPLADVIQTATGPSDVSA